MSTPLLLDLYQTRMPLIGFFLVFCVFVPLIAALSSYYEVRWLQLGVFLVLGLFVSATLVRPRSTSAEDRMLETLVWSVSLSLLLLSASASQYLSGWDIQREFAIFQQVSRTGVWNVEADFYYNSVISISILPAIVRAVSGLSSQDVFKFLYPLMFSIVPLVLYKIYRRVLSPRYAFLSAFLFVSYWTGFTEVESIGKQIIAELLLVLLFWVFLSGVNEKRSGAVVAGVLSAGVVVSHYTLSYVLIALLAFSLIVSHITRRVAAVCTLMTMVLCSVMSFGWYMLVARGGGLAALADFASTVAQSVARDFLNPNSRPLVILQAAGLSAATPGFLHDLYRLTNYAVQFCILVGFIVFARKGNKSLAERRMLPLMAVSLVFLCSAIILPFFSGIPFPRVYHISLLLISPCFVIGVELLESWWRRACNPLARLSLGAFKLPFSWRGVMAATILLSYFLFSSGWVWAVSLDRPTNVVFEGRRMADSSDDLAIAAYYSEFDVPADVNGAFWLRSYGQNGHLCADLVSSYHVLMAYGEFESTLFTYCNLRKSYLFLSELNILYAIVIQPSPTYGGEPLLTKISTDLFTHGSNRLYSNGGTAIYAGVG